MTDLDLRSLRLLVAVCEHGSIRHAAVAEHIEPSAISKRIAQLEERLGTALLERRRRGVAPTPAGEAVLAHARTLGHTLQQMEADAAAFAGGLRGQVRLVASVSAIAESLLEDLAAFMRDAAHAAIQVDVEEQLSRDVVRLVAEGSAQLGVCWDAVDFRGLRTRPYREDRLALCVPPGHVLAGRRRVGFAETLDHAYVGLPPRTAVYAMLQREAARAGRALGYRIVVSSFDAALRAVAAGLGVSLIPAEVMRGPAQRGEVVMVALQEAWAQRRFALCLRAEGSLPPAAARLAEHLADQAARASHAQSTA